MKTKYSDTEFLIEEILFKTKTLIGRNILNQGGVIHNKLTLPFPLPGLQQLNVLSQKSHVKSNI